ncbi:coiled-coil alpha-helical rod protein 1-like [Acanthaster planci]|uniref:Coiled-coil alpha-helical rod protein 1 n=1 Tax=Acanthaster planci TaxID=133434 RepID=A0A8B7ZND0_ACAPL|nr:coiled-coil alpha-helical rod protein 1-like [Acanthaster planci]
MAANLNPPSHFAQPLVEPEMRAEGTRLLPPSSFQRRDVPDPWQALAHARNRLDELQQENEMLRNTKPREKTVSKEQQTCDHPCMAVSRPIPEPPLPPSPLPTHQFFHLQHTADILSKQATELAQVRSEVMTLRSQRQKEVGELEERLREVEVKYTTETASLMATKKCQEEELRAQMSILKTKHDSEVTSKQDTIKSLNEELMRTQTLYKQEVSQLREKLLTSQAESERIRNELVNSNREKNLTIESLQSQVSKLKTYIGDAQTTSRSTAHWQVERDQLLKKIKDLEKDLDNQHSAVQLLNVRLSSTNEILGIQEAELSRVKGESVDSGKKLQLLLTRWREKVFELLVQLKSQEIVGRNVRRDHKWQVAEFEEKMTSLENKCHLLEHSIADREAQLQLERGQSQSLQDELASVQQVAELLDAKLKDYEETVPQLTSLLQSFRQRHAGTEEKLCSLTARLGSFDQRISFAVGRIEILKGLVARKEALWRLGEKETPSTNQEPTPDEKEQVVERSSLDQLRTELERVTHERDALAARIKQDSEAMQEQYNKVTAKFESRHERDAARLQDLELKLQHQLKDLKSVSGRLDQAESECKEYQRTIGRLKTELAKSQLSADRASADKMAAMETQLTNQLAEMEKRLNDARREQAKAVVSLRQQERQMTRERERAAQMMQTQEEHFQLEIDRVTSQLREADKDRNLLMATLKQEGLVGQYKAQRAAARRPDIETEKPTEKPPNGDSAKPGKAKGHTATQVKPKVPLSAILTELQSLTAQVLEAEDTEHSDVEDTDKG